MVIVVLGIVLDGKRVLLTQRPPTGHLPLSWEFPGGKLESGESPSSAVVREMREETGIEVEPIRPLAFRYFSYPDRNVLLLPYLCKIVSGEPERRDCHAIGWFLVEELSTLKFPEANVPIVDEILDLLRMPAPPRND